MLAIENAAPQKLDFMPQCHIASMVIYCKPENMEMLAEVCGAMVDSTVYRDARDTAFVLVVERSSDGALHKTMDQLNALKGIINVSLVYHHCDTEASLSEELSS